jgi:DNA-binding NarL/FixJ family response regulator
VSIRVLLAEDSYIVRRGLVSLIECEPELELVATCEHLDELLRSVDAAAPHVVLTDIRMPPSQTDEGIRAAQQLRTTHPEVGVVVLSQHLEPEYVLAFLEHGSQGRAYLLKEKIYDPEQLLAAVKAVAAGGSLIDPKVTETLVADRLRVSRSPLSALTPREHEVLAEMAQGKDNAAIAKSLFMSLRAVERHINAIFSKLALSEEPDVHRRVRAVLLFLSEAP